MSAIEDLKQNSRDTAAAAKARIQQSYGQAKSVGSEIAEKGREQAHQLGEKVAPAIARGKEHAARANSKLKSAAEEQPFTLLAGAAAIGALLGSLIPKRSKPDE